MQTSTGLAWVGNAADAPYPLRHRLDARGTPKCFKILGGGAADGQAGAIADQTPYLTNQVHQVGRNAVSLKFVLRELAEGPPFVASPGHSGRCQSFTVCVSR
jgi:hypothetical protein